ncbi:MAG TPA: type II toxin-antitoxin system death-on-curing family toxin, partial [Thermodesulfovibrionales bacterium]|nr:type II toxin-antitoxin system death-on-curing family toxin [Thermodesulfovibrionales bacterium]
QIEQYGGSSGIREIGLLSSAVAMPYATFSGDFLHSGIFQMAAAYAFHISRNHPFVDGNKRTALASALVFLELNGVSVSEADDKLYEVMLMIAAGKMAKEEFAGILRNFAE